MEVGHRRSPVTTAVAVVTGLVLAVHLWGLYRVTGPPQPPWFPNVDKLEHLIGFATPTALVLATLALRARDHGRAIRHRTVAVVVAAFVAHAGVSEVVQGMFYRTRTGDPWDAMADSVGVALGLAVFCWVVRPRVGAGRAVGVA